MYRGKFCIRYFSPHYALKRDRSHFCGEMFSVEMEDCIDNVTDIRVNILQVWTDDNFVVVMFHQRLVRVRFTSRSFFLWQSHGLKLRRAQLAARLDPTNCIHNNLFPHWEERSAFSSPPDDCE